MAGHRNERRIITKHILVDLKALKIDILRAAAFENLDNEEHHEPRQENPAGASFFLPCSAKGVTNPYVNAR